MFSQMISKQIQHLHAAYDPESGLRAIIAIHSTARGPAIGGCRFVPYHDEQQALNDAVRLAEGMSYKAAMAGLPHGGGKAVILYPEGTFNRKQLMRAFGRFVQLLNGCYITAMDSGTETSDMDQIAQSTSFVTCTSRTGDPSPYTADGVLAGIRATVRHKTGAETLNGLTVSIQGLGHVGYSVASLLHAEQVKLIVSDIDNEKARYAAQRFDAQVVAPERIYAAESDLFCPCGLGAVINTDTLPLLRCSMVAGSANNVLATPEMGDLLQQRSILYAPDYVINAGGLIFVAHQYAGRSIPFINQQVAQIDATLQHLFVQAEEQQIAPHRCADRQAKTLLTQTPPTSQTEHAA